MNRTMALSGRLRRVGFWEGVFGVLVLTFGLVTILRFTQGLGAVTNLSDEEYAERADYAFGDYRYFIGEPRSLFVDIGWQL